jgi:predicted acylesterase/phospholipase RssA
MINNNINNNNANIDTLCLSCGGTKCISMLGALKYVEENIFDINKIKKYYGTSGGAIINYLLIIGYNIDEIYEFIFELELSKLIDSKLDIDNFINNKGISNGYKFIYVLKKLLYNKIKKTSITFIELFNLYNKELYIFGTNFTKGIEICFSHINHPNMDIFLALRITISMPYMLYPVIINNEYYLDGAITNSFPIDYCNQDNTIGIFIKYHIQNNFINFFDIYKKSLNILCDIVVENKINNYKNIITIMSDSKNNIKGITNLNIDKKYKQYLFELGYNCAKIHYS